MLGRLLGAASSLNPAAYGRNNPPLESATEEEHTRSLLFPDPSLLQHSSHAYPFQSGPPSPLAPAPGGFDDRGGLELDLNKDFRVIIAQDALGDQDEPCVLLDTQSPLDTPAPVSTARQNVTGRFSPRHRRGVSSQMLNSTMGPTSPDQPAKNPITSPSGAFFKPRGRSATIALNEKDAPFGQDPKDDTKTILDCMFGSSLMGHKGASTKLHILNSDGTASTATATASKGGVSKTADATVRKDTRLRQPLARAHTYGSQSQNRPGSISEGRPQNEAVLLTRVFAVNLPEPADADDEKAPSVPGPGHDAAYPFPDMGANHAGAGRKIRKLKEKKTPAYAISIVVRLPHVARPASSRPSSRRTSQVGGLTRAGGSLSSSVGSDLPSSWTFLDSFPAPAARALAESIDARIDALVEHWDVVSRTLSALEKDASRVILRLLHEKDLATRVPAPKIPKEKTMQRTNQRIIQLMPCALFAFKDLYDKALHAANRLCFALRIPLVTTGQQRWSIWQDEARWISRWASGRDENFFFYTILTAFLGSHTEWLADLGTDWYRRRYARQKQMRAKSETLPSRTVIISPDKMTARRIVFLLSSFLPSTIRKDIVGSPMRPPTSSTHSPPIGNVSRQPSLRRTLSRRALDNRLGTGSPDKRGLSTSVSSTEGEAFDMLDSDPGDHRLHRTDSETPSIRTARLALPSYETTSRKSSAATPATITPMAHFATPTSPSKDYFFSRGRENSNESAASNLAGNLKKHESASASAFSGSERDSGSVRWGSFLSGIWSNKMDSPSDTHLTDSSLENVSKSPVSPSRPQSNQLSQMVNEVERLKPNSKPIDATYQAKTPDSADDTAIDESTIFQTDQENVPIKLMVDESDGIVDVGINIPGFFSSSVDSPLDSPKPQSEHRPSSIVSIDGYASLHGHTSASNSTTAGVFDIQSNVAGWLRMFHEDFILQAVRPYPELESHIKNSMLSEPTPPMAVVEKDSAGRRWVEVCTTLVADVRNFTIKRYTLKREVPTPSNKTPDVPVDSKSPIGKPDAEEKLIVEPVMDFDPTLIDAVERLVHRSNHPTRANSPARGMSRNHSRNPSISSATGIPPHVVTSATKDTLPTVLEVSRSECRKVIVNALRDIARTVTDEMNRKEGGRDIKNCNGNGTAASSTSSSSAVHSSTVTAATTASVAHDKARPRSAKGISEDSTLREGVRKWLKAVEYADGY